MTQKAEVQQAMNNHCTHTTDTIANDRTFDFAVQEIPNHAIHPDTFRDVLSFCLSVDTILILSVPDVFVNNSFQAVVSGGPVYLSVQSCSKTLFMIKT